MSENYAQAALRHWRDAELLKQQERVENADHHYGIAAECALKTALVTMPRFTEDGNLSKGYKEHVDTLWDKIQPQSLEKRFPSLPSVLRMPNPFQDWNVDQRYGADHSISTETMESHRNFTRRLLGAVQLSGVLVP